MTGPNGARLGAALDEFITGALSELAGIRRELSQLRAEASVRWAFVETQLEAAREAEYAAYEAAMTAGDAEAAKLRAVVKQAQEAEAEALERASGRVARLLQEVASHRWLTPVSEESEAEDLQSPSGLNTQIEGKSNAADDGS